MLHFTRPDRVDAILSEGLQSGREPELTADAPWTIAHYGTNPVFLTTPDSDFITVLREGPWVDHAAIEVDVHGIDLVADLACLIDHGARLATARHLAWQPSRAPDAIRPFLGRGGRVAIRDLLDPGSAACRAAIALTGTAACLHDVPASRLSHAPAAPAMAR